jgi:hypothetical protein
LSSWLIKNNKEFRDAYDRDLEYSSKKNTTIQYAVLKKQDRIKSKIQDLIQLGLIYEAGTVEAEKVKTLVSLYAHTGDGYFITWLLERQDPKKRKLANNTIYDLIQSNLRRYNSSFLVLASKLYAEYEQKGMLDYVNIIIQEDLSTNTDNLQTIFDIVLASIFKVELKASEITKSPQSIFFKTFKSLDLHTQNIFQFILKSSFENTIRQQYAPKEWEELWIKNVNNYSKVVLYGNCKKCHEARPVVMDTIEFMKNGSPLKFNVNTDCQKCKTKRSFEISTRIPNRPIRINVLNNK